MHLENNEILVDFANETKFRKKFLNSLSFDYTVLLKYFIVRI